MKVSVELILIASLAIASPACSTVTKSSGGSAQDLSSQALSVLLESEPAPFRPKLVISGVNGVYGNVTDVAFEAVSEPSIPLFSQGNGTWIAQLTPKQYERFISQKTNGAVEGELVIHSETNKSRSNFKREHVVVQVGQVGQVSSGGPSEEKRTSSGFRKIF